MCVVALRIVVQGHGCHVGCHGFPGINPCCYLLHVAGMTVIGKQSVYGYFKRPWF